MEKDILRKLIIANRNESNFYIACLQKQIDSVAWEDLDRQKHNTL